MISTDRLSFNAKITKALTEGDYSSKVLVLYLERPATQQCAVACSLAGRFGYSDLKEAAPTEAYALCIGLSGCRGIRNRLSGAESDGLDAGWSGAVARRGRTWRREWLASEGFCPDETRSPRRRRSTGRGR
jgi:hypothetical protein